MPQQNQDQAIFRRIWDAMDQAYLLMAQFDSASYQCQGETLHPGEGHTLQLIGRNPGVTVSELAATLGRTPSACSQMIRRLRQKGWVRQQRPEENRRLLCLYLTDAGQEVYQRCRCLTHRCWMRNCQGLAGFTTQQLETYLAVQAQINASFRLDVAHCQTAQLPDQPRPGELPEEDTPH